MEHETWSAAMSGDDNMFDAVVPVTATGKKTKCPRCLKHGLIDDVHNGDVIIRHDATNWHVITKGEANSILWEPWVMRP